MTPTDLLIPTYRQMLRMLCGLLDTAQQQMPDRMEALMSARLADDMYPLATQLRFAALQAQEAGYRLRGEDMPGRLLALGSEARGAGEAPGSVADARSRIDEALAFLAEARLDAEAPVALELPNGMAFNMAAEEYVRDWALPQFYFHVVTAYAILRHHGVAIGKGDYVPHMFAYLRPGTAPGA
ncbi:hypothetical protein COA17_06000 [Sphingomonas ginsenosidimutans]|jgi:hypothetical protein|uniref:DUF1993 domain-containing protein n=1 Tax=Sphingomonas ginsenosidimutans TaxID=862134 RepID=A0A2A4HX43_9SPHN|nr:DUF1993 domain-containing protein [Sphingomonas ginsenosidimutans]MEE2916957.1 DUF1993 domain-containing protein [Pseudomonadota bacterium]PCG09442.1 hypothetical protein COA17_06000 [Sphingomonas ginsenosidimutans]